MPTNFTGFIAPPAVDLLPVGSSTDVTSTATYQIGQNVSLSSSSGGANSLFRPAGGGVSISHSAVVGYRFEMFGGQLFEKVIVIPRTKSLGFVITATQFGIEVWNAFRDMDQILDSIAITGTGGLTLADPFGEPLIYAALGSRLYQATVPSVGPAQ